MNILSWLDGVNPADPQQLPGTRKRKQLQQQQQQTPSLTASTTDSPGPVLPPAKRQRPGDDNEGIVDSDSIPRARSGEALSVSDAGGYSSNNSGISPTTKRQMKLELASNSPVSVRQIFRTDRRMPAELKTILRDLGGFQRGNGIVPAYLAAEIRTRAEYDDEFYNFAPSAFERRNEEAGPPASNPRLSLHRILEVFESAKECLDEGHAEAAWNALVHWPVFELALGAVAESAPLPGDEMENQGREDRVRVRAMPCTAARLTGHARGSETVDYCIFVEPGPDEAAMIDELRERGEYINHTDYNPLRRRPIVLSAGAVRPDEGLRNAQLRLGVWQAAQWKFLLDLLASESEGTQVPVAIPFLPALIIQGHNWYFTATTRFNNETILCVKQPIGATQSILGIFQILHALRHIAAWIRTTYWPWYKHAVLHLPVGTRRGVLYRITSPGCYKPIYWGS